MSYSQDIFQSYLSKMADFEQIAARKGLALKELLIKKVGLDEVLADALVEKWENENGGATGRASAGAAASQESFKLYLSQMSSFQKLADLRGIPLRDWLMAKCGVEQDTADALIKQWELQSSQKSPVLLRFETGPAPGAEIPDEEKAAGPAGSSEEQTAAGSTGRKRPRGDSDDLVVTISRPADEPEHEPEAQAPVNDIDSQIDRLHSLADLSGNKEPLQLIEEIKAVGYKRDYLPKPVSYDEKENADRILNFRDEQNKKLSRLEKNLDEARQSLAALVENPPKLFGRTEHAKKMQDAEAAGKRIEKEIGALNLKKSEKQAEYSRAAAAIVKYAQGQ
jgi:hypothetical protein